MLTQQILFIIITILIKLNTLKVIGFVELRTTSLMLKAHNNQLPYCIQETLLPRVSHCNLRGTNMFETIPVRTNFRSGCFSVKGVKLWNSLCDEFTTTTSVPKFKMLFKLKVIDRYKLLQFLKYIYIYKYCMSRLNM